MKARRSFSQAIGVGLLLVLLIGATWWWVSNPDSALPHGNPGDAGDAGGAAVAPTRSEAAEGVRRTLPATDPTPQDGPVATPPATGTLIVRVVAGGQPIAGLAVRVAPQVDPKGLRPARVAWTDAQGQARFQDLPAGHREAYCTAAPNPYARRRYEVVAGETRQYELQLGSGIEVTGTVRDIDGGVVPGARLVIRAQRSTRCDPLVRCDAAGSYRLPALARGGVIGARANGYAPSRMHRIAARVGTRARVDFVLPGRGGSLHGRVFGPDGEPRSKVLVHAGAVRAAAPDQTGIAPSRARCRTGVDGRFELRELPAGALTLVAEAAGLCPERRSINLDPGARREVRIDLAAGAICAGTVRDAEGDPVTGVWVFARREGAAPSRARTATDGAYRLTGLPAGPARLSVRHAELGSARTTRVFAAGETLHWNPVLNHGDRLEGKVVDRDGHPLAGAQVDLSGRRPSGDDPAWFRRVWTDDAGVFRVGNCPGGLLRARARRPGYRPGAPVWIDPRAASTLLRLVPDDRPTGRIVGRLLDPDGRPVTAGTVCAFRDGIDDLAEGSHPDPEGRFDIPALHPDRYAVTVFVTGYPKHRSVGHAVPAGGTCDVGTIRLVRGGWLRVRPVAPPEAGARIAVVDARGAVVARRVPGVDAARIGPLAPGIYRVRLRGSRVLDAEVSCRVVAGTVRDVSVPVQGGHEVRLEIRPKPGAGWPGNAELRIVSARHGITTRALRLEHDGRFHTTLGLRPGTYRVEVRAPSSPATEARADLLVTGGTQAQVLRLTLR